MIKKNVFSALTGRPDPKSDADIDQALNLCVALDAHSHGELAQNLLRHGAGIELDVVDSEDRTSRATPTEYVTSLHADLLVGCAYGLSRANGFILGGATKTMLGKPPVPVFLSH